MNHNQLCPIHQIIIDKNREIILTDDLSFPWTKDPNGYFLVKIENDQICCGFVSHDNIMKLELRGKNPDKIIKEITKRNFCSKENLAYIAQELMIAYNSIKNNTIYVQR